MAEGEDVERGEGGQKNKDDGGGDALEATFHAEDKIARRGGKKQGEVGIRAEGGHGVEWAA